MDDDVLARCTTAFAYFGQAGRPHERKAFAEHPRRRVELAEIFPLRGVVAGFLLELAHRAFERFLALGFVADQPGGQFEAELAERDAVLLDQHHVAGIEREDHRRADVARSRGILPAPATLGDDELAGPFGNFGGLGVGG